MNRESQIYCDQGFEPIRRQAGNSPSEYGRSDDRSSPAGDRSASGALHFPTAEARCILKRAQPLILRVLRSIPSLPNVTVPAGKAAKSGQNVAGSIPAEGKRVSAREWATGSTVDPVTNVEKANATDRGVKAKTTPFPLIGGEVSPSSTLSQGVRLRQRELNLRFQKRICENCHSNEVYYYHSIWCEPCIWKFVQEEDQ